MTTTEDIKHAPDLVGDLELAKWKVDRLREKLGEKAKREKDFKFYSLYGHICNMHVLKVAFWGVRTNKGSSGIDGMTIESLDSKEKVMEFLMDIQKELQDKTYKPQPVKRVYIPKPDGKLRPLGIPTLRDRVVQSAARLILEPIFESDFQNCSYGFRPGRSQHQALATIRDAIKSGKTSVYDADLKGYFDSIPHDKLMSCLKMRIADRNVLHLIKMWLEAPVHEKNDNGTKISKPTVGTPQGGVISPLLANIFLHWFDVVFNKSNSAKAGTAALVRYADDFVILAKDVGKKCVDFVEEKIESWLGLVINKEKTKIVNLREGDELNFLGFTFRFHNDLKGRGHKYLHLGPSAKSVKKMKLKLKELTSSSNCYKPIRLVIEEVNMSLKGWANYFKFGYPRMAFRDINFYVYECLRNHLDRRSQRSYSLPEGGSLYTKLRRLGLIYL